MKKVIIILSLLLIPVIESYGQGCSDAGFCTINSLKPDNENFTGNQIKIGTFYGKADYSISVFGGYLEYNRQFNKNLGLDLKLTSLGQSGNDISSFGISDVFLNANYKVSENFKITVGTKIPLSKSDKMKDGLPLPMDYQSSLGTFDLIIGIGYEIKKLQIIAAMQQPLTQNDNMFFAEDYPVDSPLREFQSTNKYKRSADVLLRVSYPLQISKNLIFTPSILPIFHLADDKYTDKMNVEKMIDGSKGLTLNGNVYFDYSVSKKSTIQLNAGVPLASRKSRPDGLTRKFIANLEYRVIF